MKFTFEPESKPLDGYTIKRAIDRGGFGEVYYALSDAGKEVALKLLQENMDVELRGISQCLNLKHPNLVTIFDIRQDADDDHWIVMEFVSGKSLDVTLGDNPTGLPMEQVKHWLSGICRGISYLHDHGIVHRDLKPANVFHEHGVVKIGDVGLSKFITPSRRSAHTQSVGTVYYMAPEVAHGRYGREVDVYSIGVILYEMLTGRVPFDGETTGEILMKHLSEQPDLSPIPPALRTVIGNALEKDPLRRTASVDALLKQFERAVVRGRADDGQRRADSQAKPRAHGDFADVVATAVSGEAVRRAAQDVARTATRTVPKVGQAAKNAKTAVSGLPLWMQVIIGGALLVTLGPPLVGTLGTVFVFVVMIMVFGTIAAGVYHAFRLLFTAEWPWQRTHEPPERRPAPDSKKDSVVLTEVSNRTPVSRPVAVKRPIVRRPASPILGPATRRQIPWRTRIADWSGNLVVAVITSALMTTGLAALSFFNGQVGAIALFSGTLLVASWSLLSISKATEGRSVDPLQLRVLGLVAGAGVGMVAHWLDSTLLVDMANVARADEVGLFHTVFAQPLYVSGQPTMVGYVAFFASLFALRRWWWHADSLRSGRLRITSVLLTVMLGMLIGSVFSFPLEWAGAWAATISSVVQLSASWISPEERKSLVTEGTHG